MEPRVPDKMLRQLPVRLVVRGRVGIGDAMPCSRSPPSSSSMLRGMGSADEEELLTDSAAWICTSSSLSSRYGSYRGLDGDPRARDRTTSPLQIGHVRRRVVSQGVLR